MIDDAPPAGAPLGQRPSGSPEARERKGRYSLHAEIASGGMATVYYGQMVGAHGFSRVVAIKRMLPRLAREPSFRSMFVDEARLASRVQHPNVVPILDVVDEDGEVMIVMEYVRGPSLSALLSASIAAASRVPVPIAASVVSSMLAGLHAAHEARDRAGRTLGIVHRDVSPQNVLVGFDGVTRIMDFGVAKASNRMNVTEDRQLKGKLSYMAPEQFQGGGVDRRTDVFAAAVVLWGVLAGRRLFRGSDVTETMSEVLRCDVPPLASIRDDVPPALEAAIRAALNPDREARPPTAEALALSIEAATPLASSRAVGQWAQGLAAAKFAERDLLIVEIEKTSTGAALPLDRQAETRAGFAGARAPEVTDSRAVTTDWTPGAEEPSAQTATTSVVDAALATPPPRAVEAPRLAARGNRRLAGVAIGAGAIVLVAAGAWGLATRGPAASEEGARGNAASAAPAGKESSVAASPAGGGSAPIAIVASAPSATVESSVSAAVDARKGPAVRSQRKSPPTAAPPSTNQPSTGRGPYYPPAAFPK